MKRYSVFWGIQEMQIKLQMHQGEKAIKFSRECWENTLMHFQGLWIVSSFSVSTKIKRNAPELWISVCELRGMRNTSTDFQQSDFISDAKPLMFQVAENTVLILVEVSLGHIQRYIYTVLSVVSGPLTCKDQTTRFLPCSVFGLG